MAEPAAALPIALAANTTTNSSDDSATASAASADLCAICGAGSAAPSSGGVRSFGMLSSTCGHRFHQSCLVQHIRLGATGAGGCPACSVSFPPAFITLAIRGKRQAVAGDRSGCGGQTAVPACGCYCALALVLALLSPGVAWCAADCGAESWLLWAAGGAGAALFARRVVLQPRRAAKVVPVSPAKYKAEAAAAAAGA